MLEGERAFEYIGTVTVTASVIQIESRINSLNIKLKRCIFMNLLLRFPKRREKMAQNFFTSLSFLGDL